MYEITYLDNNVERMLEDQRSIVELGLSIKKLQFQRKNNPYKITGSGNNLKRMLEDQRSIVELGLSIKKLQFQRKKKSYIKVLEP
jgi:predicted transcriptional regulator with HTH domain